MVLPSLIERSMSCPTPLGPQNTLGTTEARAFPGSMTFFCRSGDLQKSLRRSKAETEEKICMLDEEIA